VIDAVTPRRVLVAILGVAVAAGPVGLALASGPRGSPASTPPLLRAPLDGRGSAPATLRDAARSRLEDRYLRLARAYDRLTGRHTAGTRAVRTQRLSRPALRAAERALGAEVRQLDVPVPAVLHRIATCESHGDPRAIGGGGAFRGALQFTRDTWASVGGRGDPAAAPLREQLRRGAILLRRSGRGPWPVCGA